MSVYTYNSIEETGNYKPPYTKLKLLHPTLVSTIYLSNVYYLLLHV